VSLMLFSKKGYPQDKHKTTSIFSVKKATSKRFFQLSFEGFKPVGKNVVERFLNTWKEFLTAFALYIFTKIRYVLVFLFKLVLWLVKFPAIAKDFMVTKLIWSRGKLGRPIATSVVLGVSFGVFILGEVLSGSTLIVNQPVNADYLQSRNDIIPKKEIALTTIPEGRRTESFTYTISAGDSLYTIGTKFKTSVDALKYINGLTDSSILSIGQTLTIPPSAGLIHKVEDGDTLTSIAAKYDVPPQAIADFNYLLDTSKLAVGTELVIPGGKVPVIVPVPIYVEPGNLSRGPNDTVSANPSLCVWPTTVRIITQYFSWYHNGLDIAAPRGGTMPPLLACMGGTVVRAGWDPWGLGLHIRIDHGNGFETVYGHMSRIDVSYGERVKRGEIVGLMGSTGNSTGPHIHYMVKYNGVSQNPLSFTR
jgi:murein DD-endopeptidase MepM/ murein hydrolase activator NlpD